MDDIQSQLLALRREWEAQREQYHKVVAEIQVKRNQFAEAMKTLETFGCSSIEEAQTQIADLNGRLAKRVEEIRELLK